MFNFLENRILDLSSKDENVSVCILGDARTGTLDDCLSIDGGHDEINDADIPHGRLMNLNSTAENKNMTFSEKRLSLDNIVNSHGRRLIDMCKSLGLYIMNGRCGLDRDVGKLTCKNSSVVDYAISTPDLFNDVIGFQIRDFEELLSDIHCPMELCFDFNSKSKMPLINSKESRLLESKGRATRKLKWKPEVKANFIEKLNDHAIENINLTLEVIATNIDVNQKMIDDVVTDVCSCLKLAASDAGVVTSDKHRRKPGRARQQPLQPWFNKSCKENSTIYQKSKRKYRKNKTDEHLISMQNASNAY